MQLKAGLAVNRSGPVEIRTTAEPGATSDWGVAHIDAALAPVQGQQPHALLVELIANDASLWRGVSLAKSRSNHLHIIAAAHKASIPVFLLTLSPAFGFKRWVRFGQHGYRELYTSLAGPFAQGPALQWVEVIDTWPAWLKADSRIRRHYMPDDLHPTANGISAFNLPMIQAVFERVFLQSR